MEVTLETGRTHQIRAQFSHAGHPLLGDGKYGSREKAPFMALWANKLSFTYKGKKYEFSKEPDHTSATWNIFN